jgi:hypothetical protein
VRKISEEKLDFFEKRNPRNLLILEYREVQVFAEDTALVACEAGALAEAEAIFIDIANTTVGITSSITLIFVFFDLPGKKKCYLLVCLALP